MIRELGVMQGRMFPPQDGRFQSFPSKTWKEEFPRAAECGLDRIEWIVDDPDWQDNPILHERGRKDIVAQCETTGVAVRSVCADLFMPNPLHTCSDSELETRESWLARIIEAAGMLNVEHIDVPFVDASAIPGDAALDTVAQVFRRAGPLAEAAGLSLCLETSLPPKRFRKLLEAIGHPSVGANHDIGNSASLAYDADEEFSEIGSWIRCIHIKDRALNGGTVPLGTGHADFKKTLAAVKRSGYAGHFILQAARGEDGDELDWMKKNAAFAGQLIKELQTDESPA